MTMMGWPLQLRSSGPHMWLFYFQQEGGGPKKIDFFTHTQTNIALDTLEFFCLAFTIAGRLATLSVSEFVIGFCDFKIDSIESHDLCGLVLGGREYKGIVGVGMILSRAMDALNESAAEWTGHRDNGCSISANQETYWEVYKAHMGVEMSFTFVFPRPSSPFPFSHNVSVTDEISSAKKLFDDSEILLT